MKFFQKVVRAKMTKSLGIGRGARPSGSGRPKGIPNKDRRELVRTLRLSPLSFMLSIVEDLAQPIAVRLMAARFAAPYVHTTLLGVGRLPVLSEMGAEELEDWFRRNEEDALRNGTHPRPSPQLLNGGDG
jgi:hypothetical protein